MNNRSYVTVLISTVFVAFCWETACQEKSSKTPLAKGYPYELPQLGYRYASLEPYIDVKTMETHYTKHHQKYVDELNAVLKGKPRVAKIPLEKLLSDPLKIPRALRTKILNNAGGHYNHSFFWLCMTPCSSRKPTPVVEALLTKHFSDFDSFKTAFSTAAKSVFGSGYAWLVLQKDGSCAIITTANQDTPFSRGMIPLLCLDVWEHAYYLKFHNRRPDYIDQWWNVVNWDHVEQCYTDAQGSQRPPKNFERNSSAVA